MVGKKFSFNLQVSLISKASLLFFWVVAFHEAPLTAQGNAEIVLGSIESELQKKQVPVDLGNTPKMISSIVSKAIKIHGGLRLASTKESRFSATFNSSGQNVIQVSVASGFPKKVITTYNYNESNINLSIAKAFDKLVMEILGIPGFFGGKLCFLSNLSGKKEIFVSDALMTSARPQTSFGKITFNPSWDNRGQGIFFTSNRQVFNNVFYLNLENRKLSTIANYRGSNLRAVQNPRSNQIALILSTSGNPEVWLASSPSSKPSRLTRNRSNESGPSWSSDGRRLLVTSDSRGKPQIYEVSVSSGQLTRIPTNISSHCTEPTWNPRHATKFAFTAAVGGGFQVCEYDFSSRKTRILTQGTSHSMQPCWASDGRHLYFTERTTSGSTKIMILDTELEGSTPIALHGATFGNCSQVNFYYPN
jgi:TolB protein